jgi:hypothetical protein
LIVCRLLPEQIEWRHFLGNESNPRTKQMRTDLTREQTMMIVERARYQRSLAAGDFYARVARRTLSSLVSGIDRFLHLLLMSPTGSR